MNTIDLIREYPVVSTLAAILFPMLDNGKLYKIISNKINSRRARIEDILLIDNNKNGLDIIKNICKNDLPTKNEDKPIVQMELYDLPEWPNKIDEFDRLSSNIPIIPKQLSIFDNENNTDEHNCEVKPKNQKKERIESPLFHIGREKNNGDTAVVLISQFNFDDENHGKKMSYYFKLKKELQEHYKIKKLRIFGLVNASRKDLLEAIKNPNIQHIIVDGHGSWDSWTDDNGRSVTNDRINKNMNIGESGMSMKIKKKKSFIRNTCGDPNPYNTFDDQLGTPFANDVFGKSITTDGIDFFYEPLGKTSEKDFLEQKNKSIVEIDREGKWKYRKERHSTQRKVFINQFINNLNQKINSFIKNLIS